MTSWLTTDQWPPGKAPSYGWLQIMGNQHKHIVYESAAHCLFTLSIKGTVQLHKQIQMIYEIWIGVRFFWRPVYVPVHFVFDLLPIW